MEMSSICWKCEVEIQDKICIGDTGFHTKYVLNPWKLLQPLKGGRTEKEEN